MLLLTAKTGHRGVQYNLSPCREMIQVPQKIKQPKKALKNGARNYSWKPQADPEFPKGTPLTSLGQNDYRGLGVELNGRVLVQHAGGPEFHPQHQKRGGCLKGPLLPSSKIKGPSPANYPFYKGHPHFGGCLF